MTQAPQAPKEHTRQCETCERPHTDHLCEYCHVRLTESDKDFLAVVGCASHSSRPHSTLAQEHKFTCWRGECKLHDDCIYSYGEEYPPCVDACSMQAARQAREERDDLWTNALRMLIEKESVRMGPGSVNMTYSYRIAQVIESLRHTEHEQGGSG